MAQSLIDSSQRRTGIPALRFLALLYLCSAATLRAEMIDGSAIVTSRSGTITAADSSGRQVSVSTHTTLQPTGLELTTDENGRIFLTLSNGLAIALDSSSSIKCIEYTQRPFNQNEQSHGPEPSVSKLQLQFNQGRIALASNRLSPLSEIRIQLLKGEIRLNKGSCLISYESTGLHITAFDGNLTYYYPDGATREFISAPNSVRISDQSMLRQQVAAATTSDSLPADAQRLSLAAQHASKRVTFEPNEATSQPPRPVLIVSPDYFKQPPMRPYEFLD